MHHACYFVGLKGEVCIFDAQYCGEHQVSVGLFVCLFVWGFSSYLRIFHSYGDVTITIEGCKF